MLLECHIVVSVGAMAILCGASTGLPLLSWWYHHVLLSTRLFPFLVFVIGDCLVSLGHLFVILFG